jgi:transglutaminase-like putative cysteine protease
MMLAPTPVLSGQVVHLANGVSGVHQTLRMMRQLVNQCKTNTQIRQAATNTVFLTPEKDEYSEAEAIFNFVRDRIRYVKDVNDIETLSTPMLTLEGRLGDCDDQTVLLASMLESVGYPTRFVVEGYTTPGEYEHVYMQALVFGQFISMDPTEQKYMGWSPPDPVSQLVEII